MVGTIGEVEPSQLSWSLVRSEAQNWTKSQIVKGLNKEFLKNAKSLLGLVLQFEAIHQKQHSINITRTEEELDDGGGGECLAGAGGHLEQEAVFAVLHGPLQGVNGLQLIGPQETQFVGLDVAGTLGLVAPRRFGLVVRALGQHDVVVADLVLDEALRVWHDLLVADH